MPAPSLLFGCVARAAVKHLANLLTFGVGGDLLLDAWDAYRRQARDEQQRRREVEQLVAASTEEARQAAREAVAREAAQLPPEQQKRLEDFLTQAPAAMRRSLRRPADPRGHTLPAGRGVNSAEELRELLPAGLPRFQAGDRPLPGIDLELVELLGVGGFGEVWKARNYRLMSVPPVALKFCLDAEARQRLLHHEARVIDQVQSQGRLPGIVPLLRSYLSADPPCLEYEYVEGSDLAAVLREWHASGGATAIRIAHLVQALAQIVGRAHRLPVPVVHRDLKPSNVLVQFGGGGEHRYLITDFGIGGLAATHPGDEGRTVAGSYTPLYASPQQMAGRATRPADDVYSLGVIWYQALTGDLTRGAPTGDAWRKRLLDRGMTAELLAVLSACIEHEPEDRPADAVELAERIGQALAAPPLSAATREEMRKVFAPTPQPPPAKPARSVPVFAWSVRIVLLLALVGGAWYALTRWRAGPKPPGPDEVNSPDWAVHPWPAQLPRDFTNSIGMKLVGVPAGRFVMGTRGSVGAQRPHRVEISRAFYLGAHEVTQAQYHRITGQRPSYFQQVEDRFVHLKGLDTEGFPVEMVSHEDAVRFCQQLSELAEEKKAGRLYRLPTEAEWEYACRGGATRDQDFAFGDSLTRLQANYSHPANRPQGVGKTTPNGFGLYDMHGNVWEWCQDWYESDYYAKSPPTDPPGPATGLARVVRGGAFDNTAAVARSAERSSSLPTDKRRNVGFRIACYLVREKK